MSKYLTLEKQREIDSKIGEILVNTGYAYPENDLEVIIRSYKNIMLFGYDFKEDSDKISGAIAYTKGGTPKIYINRALSPERTTFTLAHEFGHLVLHSGENKFRLDMRGAYNDEDSKEETEANYFAASLLMPKERFLLEYNRLKDEHLVADYFGVSISAVRARLAWIKAN